MLRILGIGNALVDVSVFIHDDSILEKHRLHKGGMCMHNINPRHVDTASMVG